VEIGQRLQTHHAHRRDLLLTHPHVGDYVSEVHEELLEEEEEAVVCSEEGFHWTLMDDEDEVAEVRWD